MLADDYSLLQLMYLFLVFFASSPFHSLITKVAWPLVIKHFKLRSQKRVESGDTFCSDV